MKFADILTPNIPEAEFLCDFKIKNEEDMIKAAKYLCTQGAKAVLLKGGIVKKMPMMCFLMVMKFLF